MNPNLGFRAGWLSEQSECSLFCRVITCPQIFRPAECSGEPDSAKEGTSLETVYNKPFRHFSFRDQSDLNKALHWNFDLDWSNQHVVCTWAVSRVTG